MRAFACYIATMVVIFVSRLIWQKYHGQDLELLATIGWAACGGLLAMIAYVAIEISMVDPHAEPEKPEDPTQ